MSPGAKGYCCFFFLPVQHHSKPSIVNFCKVCILLLLSPFAPPPLCSAVPSLALISSFPPSFFLALHPSHLFTSPLPFPNHPSAQPDPGLGYVAVAMRGSQGRDARSRLPCTNPSSVCDLFKEKVGWVVGGAQVTLCPQTLHV